MQHSVGCGDIDLTTFDMYRSVGCGLLALHLWHATLCGQKNLSSPRLTCNALRVVGFCIHLADKGVRIGAAVVGGGGAERNSLLKVCGAQAGQVVVVQPKGPHEVKAGTAHQHTCLFRACITCSCESAVSTVRWRPL